MHPVTDDAGPLGTLPDRRLYKYRIGRNIFRRGIEGGKIRCRAKMPVGSGFGTTDCHGFFCRGKYLGMERFPLLGETEKSTVVGGINIVDPVFIDDPVDGRDEVRIIHKGKAGETALKYKFRMAWDTCGSEKTDKPGILQRITDFKSDFCSGGKNEYIFGFSHLNYSLYPCLLRYRA